jgi:hypothetical protein
MTTRRCAAIDVIFFLEVEINYGIFTMSISPAQSLQLNTNRFWFWYFKPSGATVGSLR